MTSKSYWLFRLAYCFAVLALTPVASARADFFDDARRTFETDIPHFFQDDIPCAFGGNPTSGAKTSCKSDQPPKTATENDGNRAAAPPHKPKPPPQKPKSGEVPPDSGRSTAE